MSGLPLRRGSDLGIHASSGRRSGQLTVFLAVREVAEVIVTTMLSCDSRWCMQYAINVLEEKRGVTDDTCTLPIPEGQLLTYRVRTHLM